jgi:hypothetical protein
MIFLIVVIALTLIFDFINGFTPELKTGLYYENKQRSFNARNLGYAKGSSSSLFGQTSLPVDEIFIDENINLTDGIKLMEITSTALRKSHRHIYTVLI